MDKRLKILFLSAEVVPFAKTGGLGDVAGALPKVLRSMGHDVTVVMPAYQSIEAAARNGQPDLVALPGQLNVPTGHGVLPAGVFRSQLPNTDVPVYFIAERNRFDRPNIYGYADDADRFAFFSRAALDLTLALNWRPDIVHAHDWHAAPAVTWLATAGQATGWFNGVPSVFTIHNLAHQGRTSWAIFGFLNILTHALLEENFGEVNFMARGIYHATQINTVSPTYAHEILHPAHGAGLDGLLRHRGGDVSGILNGLDYDVWNPEADPRLERQFNPRRLGQRLHNKRALQRRAGLPERDDVPLVAMVTRLDWQKGLDIVGHVVHRLMSGEAGDAQFVVLGTGAPAYEAMLAHLANDHPDKMTAVLAYESHLAPVIYGGADIFLMPSRFEPCGLGQLIAMRYGAVPVVRATGGLVDTVRDRETGFIFEDFTSEACWYALRRALQVYNGDQQTWRKIQRAGMKADFSWAKAAEGYSELYERAVARVGER